MITEYNSGRTRELLRLPRNMLRLVTGIFTGHVELNRHLNIILLLLAYAIKTHSWSARQ